MPRFLPVFLLLLGARAAFAQDTLRVVTPLVTYGPAGFVLRTAEGDFSLRIQSRLQFRYATPSDQNPQTFDDFEAGSRQVLKINRARLKVGGHGFKPWLKYYWEYELAQGNLLDFRITVERWPWLKVKVGQWKTDYNRERVISSGRQQMAERSIINRPFTLDRQQGISVYGRLRGGGAADVSYWLSALTGNGRGATTSQEGNLMYAGRWQWNFTGRELPMTGSDTQYHEQGTGLVAFGAVTNRSPYTRFSQAGGGTLETFANSDTSRYRVNQWVIETAYMYRGFSWQSEFHRKIIGDELNRTLTRLQGSYWQAGYFLHHALRWAPKPLEVAFRYARYRPNLDLPRNVQQEYSLATNWFFREHLNKLTAELTWFAFADEYLREAGGLRFRLQWEVSF